MIVAKWRADTDSHLPLPPSEYVTDIITYNTIPAYKTADYLHQKYVVEGLSLRQIAAENFTSTDVIRGLLVRFELPIRPAHATGVRNASARFGTKRRQGKLVENLAEVRVINAIKEMQTQGMTLRQIATFLSQVGVPTKQRGKSWHPEMVRRALKTNQTREY